MSLGRYYRTIRYLRFSQIRTRVFRKILTLAERVPPIAHLYAKRIPNLKITELALTRLPLPDQHYLGERHFEFISKRFDYADTWFPEGASLLWLFNLHYFDFLTEIKSPDEKKNFIFDWIATVPVCHPVGWHPYTSSLRICNWIADYPSIKPLLNEEEKQALFSSIHNQLRHLLWHLEEDLLANHLIENCRALIVGGIFLNQESFVSHGMKVLLRELPEQVLSDGGHYERSPQYHTEVLLALLDTHAALRQSSRDIPALLVEKIEAMTHFLAKILDFGKLPGLNDTSPEFVPDPQAVIAYAAQELQIPIPSYPELDEHLAATGLFIYRSKRLSVTFDVGPIGPDVQPGHAHSDTLAVLVSIDGIPVLIDAGVYTYETGADREYFRSAGAHNGPIVNSCEPNEMWGAFRVGQREPPPSSTAPRTASLSRGGVQITRAIHVPSAHKLEIEDTYAGSATCQSETRWLLGIPAAQRHSIEARSQASFSVKTDKGEIVLTITGEAHVSLEEAPASPRFYSKESNLCLVTRAIGSGKITFALALQPTFSYSI